MKKNLIFLALTITTLFSCSSDDSSNGSPSVINYFPLTTGNYWTYDVTTAGQSITNRDSLFVANDTVIGSKTYKKMKTLTIANGFFTNTLRNNGLRKEDDAIYLTGDAGLNLGDILPIDLSVSDFIIFKAIFNKPSSAYFCVNAPIIRIKACCNLCAMNIIF